jgi:hypothetical protein
MARAMNMRAVADHIDDEATFDMLRALGCDEMQGRHVASPMKAREFEHWLETGGAAHLARAAAPDLSRALEGADLADGDLPDEDLPEGGFPDDGLPDRSLTMTR